MVVDNARESALHHSFGSLIGERCADQEGLRLLLPVLRVAGGNPRSVAKAAIAVFSNWNTQESSLASDKTRRDSKVESDNQQCDKSLSFVRMRLYLQTSEFRYDWHLNPSLFKFLYEKKTQFKQRP